MVYELGVEQLVLHLRIPILDGNGKPVLNAYGRAQITESDVPVDGCDFWVTESQETENAVTATKLTGRGMLPPDVGTLLPPGAALDHTAAVTWQGIKFEVHGPPRPVANIRDTNVDHITITCRSYLGSSIPGTREDG
ncbi:hypothetical protein [Nocardia tengchongensis]|uniref:hypothetical protein n=1 Tax=Nocardia tengchongensis TaxID=2055889 RepID=UPI00360A38EB